MQSWFAADTSIPNLVLALAAVGVLVLLVVAVLWMLGLAARRTLRHRVAEAERDILELEMTLAEQAARFRMVGELHEVALHSVSSIVAQADGARYTEETEPAAAGRAAVKIADTARSTLAELRRIMAIVRQGQTDVVRQPGIKTMRELLRVMREAGLDIRFEEFGDRFDLAHGAEVAVLRILQESLSNALKHGGEGTEVRVTFRWSEDGLSVLVDDDGVRAVSRRGGEVPAEAREAGYSVADDAAALTDTPTGPGITEMRERTELFGGVFNAYRVPGVGFSVSAAFPRLRHAKGVQGAAHNS
ncbi:histidine kinase [Salinibacterium sp. SYSU T00001]|uniref:sensor histidine kinase n=1 Tax=Homoserinimonas sedimenticola TaxID=2986805 RepID=UPI002236285F|nr:ATP-binding protein [Salinibacterium sedimenticola]MCW4384562.1 histidine kinase [Salinibacterium sedimenticola]